LWLLVERTIAASQIALLASPCIVTIKNAPSGTRGSQGFASLRHPSSR
jgi:hypothetical protein